MGSGKTLSQDRPALGARPSIFLVIGAVAYPGFLMAFASAVRSFKTANDLFLRTMFAGSAVLGISLAAAVPILSLPALMKIRTSEDSRAPFVRRVLHVMSSVPPLYTLSVVVMSMLGLAPWHTVLWLVAMATLAVTVLTSTRKEYPHRSFAPVGPRMRALHEGSAALLLAGFLITHIGSHGFALWSVRIHGQLTELLRLWYRSDWIEPVILALFAVMVLTGVPMVARYTEAKGDGFRVLQTTSGIYLAVFICSHLTAVLRARSAGVETDWIFATGPDGLLGGTGMLIPYYILAIFALAVHGAIGLRAFSLSHHLSQSAANRMTYAIIGVGGIVTFLTTLAMMGLHFRA